MMREPDLRAMPESYWRSKLTPEQYRVARERGTEAPWSGIYVSHNDRGMYCCVACGQELFSSRAKFESVAPGLQGWPAFEAAMKDRVELRPDTSLGMERTEVVCRRCGAHLGHLFEQIPGEKGKQHYCINSCALTFKGV